jgi:serine/threonine protein phosphatase PrpC
VGAVVHVEQAKLSLAGNRPENQDRVDVISQPDALLIIVVDGMGGHAHGARAAEVTVATVKECFAESQVPVFDPQGFLTLALARAHDRVVKLGQGVALDHKPRATCAVCLVQDAGSYWAHVGDSRVYHLRAGAVRERTRDHSHVELLLRSGRITESQAHDHPMRNYVECCIGGDPMLPEMSLSRRNMLKSGDVVLLCSDGLWSGLSDEQIATLSQDPERNLRETLVGLGERALLATAPYADNTTAAAIRWLGN